MRRSRLWLGVAITLCCLALALAGIDWRVVGTVFLRADWFFFLPATVMLLAFLLARSARWRMLLGPQVSLADAFAITNIGYLVSNVLPFRLGDPARAAAIGLSGKGKASTALSTVVVERLLDLLTVVVMLGMTVPFVARAGWIRPVALAAGAAGLIGLGLLITVARHPARASELVRRVLMRVPRADPERWGNVAKGLLDGLSALRTGRGLAALVAWSAVTWLCSVGCYLALLRAFVDDATVVQAAFLSGALGLGVALPSAPGAAGVFHTVARYALEMPFGIPASTAVAVAFTAHAFMYVVMCGLGIVGLATQGISWARLRSNMSSQAMEDTSSA